MFKRRPLNKEQSPAIAPAPAPSKPAQSQSQAQTQASTGQSEGPSNRGPNRKRSRNRNRNKGRGQNPNQNQGQRQGQQQQGRGGQNRGQNRNQNRRPAPPPAFFQRDVLLLLNKETAKPVEEVRAKFDPLAKKLPAHVTVLYSESSSKIKNDILKSTNVSELPKIQTLTFDNIQVVDDMYLWLVPDAETTQKLKTWHEEFRKGIAEGHTQGEKYEPHLTLGYVPRKLPEEEALAFAKNLIPTPITIKVETVLLEEFSEDQNSRSLDRLSILV